jgi:peptidoglycan/LPS O-acetylase OafA/YrhL
MTQKIARIPSLDGIRGLCMLAVLFEHSAGTRHFPVSAAAAGVWSFGNLALMVFFVMSGFLITGMLLDEQAATGEVRLGRFYLRRTLRIFPPYFALLLFIGLAASLGWVQATPRDLAHAASYTSNYYLDRSWVVGHTWSLSVEEQFYLLWPLVLVFAGTRRAVLIAAATVLLLPLVRVGEWELWRSAGDGIGHRFETIADAIAIGCVLACVRPRLHRIGAYRAVLESRWFLVVPLLAVVANMMHDHPLVAFAVSITVMNVCIVLMLDWAMTFPDGRVGRVLNFHPLMFLGLLSYSGYLWQQVFLNRYSDALINTFPLNVTLALAAALFSYYIVERPALLLRKRIESRARRRAPQPPVVADPRTDAVTPMAVMD